MRKRIDQLGNGQEKANSSLKIVTPYHFLGSFFLLGKKMICLHIHMMCASLRVHTHTCKMYIRTHNTYIYTLGIQYNSYINTYTCIEYTCVHTHTHITHAYNTFEHIHRHGFYPCTHITQG